MLAVKFAFFGDFAIQRLGDFYRQGNGRFIRHGQSARVGEAGFANICVRQSALRLVRAGAEHFAFGFQFGVDFQADNGDVFWHNQSEFVF